MSQNANENVSETCFQYIDTVYRICFSLLGNRVDAEDAVQSVFVKQLESGKTFSDEEHKKAWLIITAQNHCRDVHRKWWKKRVILGDYAMGSTVIQPATVNEVMEFLLKLPQKYKVPLYLYFYEGYKIHEIASILKLNCNTVKTRIRDAKKRLKLEIGDDYFE